MLREGEQQGCMRHEMRQSGGSRSGWGGHLGLLGLVQVLGLLWMELALTQAAPFAYITNEGRNESGKTVSIIDTATHSVIRTIYVEDHPYGVAVHPAGSFAYVTHNTDKGILSVIDATNNSLLTTLTVGYITDGVAVHPAGAFVYVVSRGIGTVSVIDTATFKVIATVGVGSVPEGIAMHPEGSFAYVANSGSSTVSVIDTATHTIAATVPVGSPPSGVAVHPAGSFVYVAQGFSNMISVIDTATHTVVATVGVGRNPFGIAVHPAGTFVYVTNYSSNSVSVIDTATLKVVATIPVGTGPFGVAVHPAGTAVYVVNRGEFNKTGSVSIIDIATGTVITTIPVGVNPAAFGQFVGPLAPPALALTLTGCTHCRVGDRLTIEARVINPGTIGAPVEAKVAVQQPGGALINLLGEHLEATLPPSLDTTFILFDTFISTEVPAGTWQLEGALLEPELGETLSRSVSSFEVLP